MRAAALFLLAVCPQAAKSTSTPDAVCGSFTSCASCNAQPGCAFCSDAADNLVDPTSKVGGWVFRERGLNGAERRRDVAAARSTDRVAGNGKGFDAGPGFSAEAYERLRREAATDSMLLQQAHASHQRHSSSLRSNEDGTATNPRSDAQVFLEVSAPHPKHVGGGRGPESVHGIDSARVTAAASEWTAVFTQGGSA